MPELHEKTKIALQKTRIGYASDPGPTPSEDGKFTFKELMDFVSAPLSNVTELKAVASADRWDGQRRYVEALNKYYTYKSSATTGDYAPNDQVGGIGFWQFDPGNGVAASVSFSSTGGVISIEESYNVSSITRTSLGHYTIYFDTGTFKTTDYYPCGMTFRDETSDLFIWGQARLDVKTTGYILVYTENPGGAPSDVDRLDLVFFGGQ